MHPNQAPARIVPPCLDAVLADFLGSEGHADDPYFSAKRAQGASRAEVLRTYARIRAEFSSDMRVLDWGCRHGVWSRLLRADFGERIQLDGCDVCPPIQYADLHAASSMNYRQIQHPWQLAYADASFDAVVAGGTLEHVPNDGASLTELWRVIKPDGALLVTHLPNRGSWSEWLSRRWFPEQAHARRYSLRAIRQRLLQYGFEPTRWGYHQLLPVSLPTRSQQHPALARVLNALQGLQFLERLWPLRCFSATLWIVARRRSGF